MARPNGYAARTMPPTTSGEPSGATGRRAEQDAWGALGLVISGVLVWGLAGGLLGAWLHSEIPVMVGLLMGMSAGLYLVWFRYGRA